ncbi:MAG: 3,4-dihydroxy-2-butanone-4-phosphate synthase [Rhodospirillales bacterium]|nr:3,4-dihydroxy-2-butanone-4-phosphate synthase [Rhodospirillales bacterium]MCW8862910.1 3,4-dihydroxy-2-butanone-4-phosphate synthase [Rhodospirillales bacterium]MCW8951121.1 3,4-dihydroxy-2-butanone-4-phosphate synthase [Rhodospirillales bacterium]MCW8969685.1 3,4-dihydroxy-2-butanone-4-phosphate synthase [Rhodospirillales bacterium]MCW9003462.1 3,4-dihydroxy-2-butanone-4-phosphate synthase [Rhodospirillales bacterium]
MSHSSYAQYLSSVTEIIEEARNGRMFVLVDDEDRENEGDLVIPAQMATPDAINFMAKYGRGLICLTLDQDRVEELNIPLMTRGGDGCRLGTAFTVSIEAREGVTTGISAGDRARTIAVAIDPSKSAADIVTPGHVFPLAARQGGTLVRAGHTEAAVDISRLAGLNPSGVICEIMNDDGTMARMPDLIQFAQYHGLKIGTIADLIAYRRRNDMLVEKTVETSLNSVYGGEFTMAVYVNKVAYAEHIALIKGNLEEDGPVMVRMHALNVLDDVLGDHSAGKAHELHQSMRMIAEHGRGVVVLIREPHPTSLSDRVRALAGEERGNQQPLRDYGVGAQILLDLGVKDMILLSNTKRTIVGLDGYGLKVVDQRPIPAKEKTA